MLEELKQKQAELAKKVIVHDDVGEVRRVAGVDVAYAKHSDALIAAVVVLDAESLEEVEVSTFSEQANFPYIPGYFSFREMPSVLKAFEKLSQPPDLVVVDGQGYAHPRRFGLACHLGVELDLPTIGCAKTRLVGTYNPVWAERGSWTDLVYEDEVVGRVLRTQDGINPVYVSVGHRVSLDTATEWALRLSPTYRLPETTRRADWVGREALRLWREKGSL